MGARAWGRARVSRMVGPRMVGPLDLLDEMADTAKARLEPGRNGEVLLRP